MKYHYTYYSYEEWGRGYIGKRSCKCKPEEDVTYFGSYKDKTFKPTQKIILATYDTVEEAIADEIKIQRFFEVVPNSHFVNQAYQTSTGFQGNSETAKKAHAKLTPEQRSERTRKGNAKLTPEQRSERTRKGQASMTPEYRKEIARKRDANMTPEQRSERTRKGNKTCKSLGIGISSLTVEQLSINGKKAGKKTSAQRWQCIVTGFISNAGNLSQYQRARGIDTSKRIRIN